MEKSGTSAQMKTESTGEKLTAAIDAYVDFLKERKAVEEAVDAAYAPVTE